MTGSRPHGGDPAHFEDAARVAESLFFDKQQTETLAQHLAKETGETAQLSGKLVALSPPSATLRNTVRSVVPIRLSDTERAQITAAAGHLGLTLSGFLRQSALQASAIIEGKVKPRRERPEVAEPERDRAPFILGDTERPHIVDGMRILPDGTVVDWELPSEY